MSHPYHRRLLKEHKLLCEDPIPGVQLLSNEEDLKQFFFGILVADNDLYPSGDLYKLLIIVTKDYPVDSPLVKFVVQDQNDAIPIHPHIYSNGHICLNLLGEDWTPACLIESILLSIHSMLVHNTNNSRPPDDERYIKNAPIDPKRSRFVFHDDNV